MSYYENSQWTAAAGQIGWEHHTPSPARSGASPAISREDPAAFVQQLEEVERAWDNLLKSGKLPPGAPGGRHGRMGITGPRSHSIAEFDARSPHPPGNLQNFYAAQRHQSSRGSSEADHMIQAKRRLAAQRERELRNYHQEQQFNRTVMGEMTYKPERALSPGSRSEDPRVLIDRQRKALYGDGSFAESGGYVDETGTIHPGLSNAPCGPPGLRGHSPLTYEYGRTPSTSAETGVPPPMEGGAQQQLAVQDGSRANSNSSPHSNPGRNPYDNTAGASAARDPIHTSPSSPGGSSHKSAAQGAKPSGPAVAPIGTRPSISGASSSALGGPVSNTARQNKRSKSPLLLPLNQETPTTTAPASNATSSEVSTAIGGSLSGWSGRSTGVWGNKTSGLGVQASVWG